MQRAAVRLGRASPDRRCAARSCAAGLSSRASARPCRAFCSFVLARRFAPLSRAGPRARGSPAADAGVPAGRLTAPSALRRPFFAASQPHLGVPCSAYSPRLVCALNRCLPILFDFGRISVCLDSARCFGPMLRANFEN